MIRLLERLHRDDGYTLIEIMIGVGLLGTVLAMILGTLTQAQFGVETQMARSETNDQLHLAVLAMDREIRSGDLLYDPSQEQYPAGCTGAACEVAAGYSMRIFSEANLPTRGDKRCVQYRITDDGELQRRDWDPEWLNHPSAPNAVNGWRVLASGLQNRAENVPAFTRPQINLVSILFLANARPGDGPISGRVPTVRAQLSISGRNSAIVSDLKQCGPVQPVPNSASPGGVPEYE